MRIALLMTVAFLSVAVLDDPASGGERLNRAGRWMGFGWSEGYHACQIADHRAGGDLPPRRDASRLSGLHRCEAGVMTAPSHCPACSAGSDPAAQPADGSLRPPWHDRGAPLLDRRGSGDLLPLRDPAQDESSTGEAAAAAVQGLGNQDAQAAPADPMPPSLVPRSLDLEPRELLPPAETDSVPRAGDPPQASQDDAAALPSAAAWGFEQFSGEQLAGPESSQRSPLATRPAMPTRLPAARPQRIPASH